MVQLTNMSQVKTTGIKGTGDVSVSELTCVQDTRSLHDLLFDKLNSKLQFVFGLTNLRPQTHLRSTYL